MLMDRGRAKSGTFETVHAVEISGDTLLGWMPK